MTGFSSSHVMRKQDVEIWTCFLDMDSAWTQKQDVLPGCTYSLPGCAQEHFDEFMPIRRDVHPARYTIQAW